MTKDASFADGQEKPINVAALDKDDLTILSALVQDAVFPMTEMRWESKTRQFGILVNRYRWELSGSSATKPERVQSVLAVENVLKVASQGIDRNDADMVLSILSIDFTPSDETSGDLTIQLAGDGAIKLTVEALECRLKDVTRPYTAPSGSVPSHK